MERLVRQAHPRDVFGDARAWLARRVPSKMAAAEPYEIIWWIFAASVTISMTSRFIGEVSAPLSYIFAIGGAAGCGWGWLLTRTLFRGGKSIERWTLLAVGGIIVVEAYWHLASVPASAGGANEIYRIAANAASFICIAALVLVFVEALSGYSANLPKLERRFRQIYISGFSAMIAVALIWAANASAMSIGGEWVDLAVLACGVVGVAGSRLAVAFRKRHPLPAANAQKAPRSLSPAANDKDLAQRILGTIEQENRFATPDLKVADLAKAMGEQDYKVSQCITGYLGYRNFNHLINARRIDHAKQALVDPHHARRPILSIAYDCGFNSIGPFNRAFKQQVGMTPREFRSAAIKH